MLSSTPFTRKGKIIYKLNGQTGTYGVHVAYKTTKRKKISYNVRGQYKRMAALASLLCDVLLLPLDAGAVVARRIIRGCGFAADAINIMLPDYYVASTRTTRHWRLRQMHNTSNECIMKGRRYHVTAKNYTGKKNFYTGSYYRPSEFTNKNPELAAAIVERIYNPYTWSVSSWEVY